MPNPGFAQMVLEQRDTQRQQLAQALGQERGPQPYAKQASEQDQDRMWLQAHPDYTDPPEVTAAFGQRFHGYKAQQLTNEQAAAHAAVETLAMYPMSKFLQLLAPSEQGGQGLTPLAASYEKYPYRRFLIEGAGPSIEDQVAYANQRAKRAASSPPPPQPLGDPARDVALAGPPAQATPPPGALPAPMVRGSGAAEGPPRGSGPPPDAGQTAPGGY